MIYARERLSLDDLNLGDSRNSLGLASRSKEASCKPGHMGAGLSILLATAIAFSGVLPALAESVPEPEFYAQCHKLLPMADDFARECLARAKPFSRTFYPGGGGRGQPESFSTYFKALDAPSHFVLGCVLDFKHQISFAGLYYSPRPLDMSHFDDYEIIFIDFGSNVGLQIDGAQNTFVAVRQFTDSFIPPALHTHSSGRNCEDEGLETIGNIKSTKTKENDLNFISDNKTDEQYCWGTYCTRHSYVTFFGSHISPIIYAEHWLFMIDSEGVLMLDREYYNDACIKWKTKSGGLYYIIHEVCGK
jgi:hypothetical protein